MDSRDPTNSREIRGDPSAYTLNREAQNVKYNFADPRVFEFISQLEALPQNNTIHPFESSEDIVSFLREQWAGLFQRYLSESVREQERRQVENLQATARTLDDLVRVLVETTKGNAEIAREIVTSNHPAMDHLRKVMNIKHRVLFTTRSELSDLLGAYGYSFVRDGSDNFDTDPTLDWVKRFSRSNEKKKKNTLSVKASIFDDTGRLRPVEALSDPLV